MEIRRIRPTVLAIEAHVHEVATLIAAARLLAADPPPDMTTEAVQQLRQVLAEYDRQIGCFRTPGGRAPTAEVD